MKKLELNQMENLEGGWDIPGMCAVTGLLFFPAHGAGTVWGGIARNLASVCWNN
jgi:hypothetical protein